jgi:hypothetical protein
MGVINSETPQFLGGFSGTKGAGGPDDPPTVSGRFHNVLVCGRLDWDLPICCVFLP